MLQMNGQRAEEEQGEGPCTMRRKKVDMPGDTLLAYSRAEEPAFRLNQLIELGAGDPALQPVPSILGLTDL